MAPPPTHLDLGFWDLPPFDSGFYPEDLPEDWRLAFYANEFRALACPATGTLLDPALISADTPAAFRLYLEGAPDPHWAGLDARLGGWFGPDGHLPLALLAPESSLPPRAAVLYLRGLWPAPHLRRVLETATQQAVKACFFDNLPSLRRAVTLADLLGISR